MRHGYSGRKEGRATVVGGGRNVVTIKVGEREFNSESLLYYTLLIYLL
jgi:hypothetical protein